MIDHRASFNLELLQNIATGSFGLGTTSWPPTNAQFAIDVP